MRPESSGRCPFLEAPCGDCYVVKLDSMTVERAIFYCGAEYEKCEMYRRLEKARRAESGRAGRSGPGSADR